MIDFSLNTYRNFLKKINKKNYKTYFFHEKIENKGIFLRHDIDADLNAALIMAEIEKEFKIKSTYFIMLNSPLYNLFSRKNIQNIHKILSLGHEIGLHFDVNLVKDNDLQKSINNDISFLNNYFNIEIKVVSFHQPSKDIIENKIKINQINTYDKDFFSEVYYVSDSNMIWKTDDPITMIENEMYLKLQILIHPIWWVNEGLSTEEKWMESIIRNFNKEQEQLLQTERAYGEKKELSWKKK